jgi:hypothetical protein
MMVLAAMHAGSPMAAAAAKELAAPAAGPVGALVLVAMKGGPTGGWGLTTAVAPMAVHAGAPTAKTTPIVHSREAATVA